MDSGTSLRVALTGAGGMLGREVRRAAAARGQALVAWDRAALDVTDADAVRRALSAANADAVIHGAAWTDVDGCEGDPPRAMRVNGDGTANVARACAECGAKLVMVSTDYVFAGDRREPWAEDDAPAPISAYGRSKLAGEEAVREILGGRGTIARTAWVYADHGKNFLLTMLRLGREKGEVRVVDDQQGSPTFAADLAEALLEVAAKGGGIYHVTNRGQVTWCGFARAIFEQAGFPVKVTAVTTAEFPRPARRPANSVLIDTRFAREGIPVMPRWEDALARCLARLAARPSGCA
jgi:dTDP-4-dehydrorhamnose reductase